MRYMARRVITGEWLDRDLPLTGVTRTRTLSGPSLIKATIEPELREVYASDGLRVIEDLATMIYAVGDDGELLRGGIVVPPTEFEDESTSLTAAGVSSYPHGFIYEDSRLWGPSSTLPRPDPIAIFRDLWEHVQSFENSDLGVVVTGTQSSTQRVGNNSDPYRLRWWEAPDVGEEMDNLAEDTPFDYTEHYAWADEDQEEVRIEVEVGWPRLGRARDDLRFVMGENIVGVGNPQTTNQFNNIIGLGNGEGQRMITGRAQILDGRLRRTLVYTNKEIRGRKRMQRKVSRLLERLHGGRYEIGEVTVIDHPNAPIDQINEGDDLLINYFVPAVGQWVNQWERVITIDETDDAPDQAQLSLIPSAKFRYTGNSAENSTLIQPPPLPPVVPVPLTLDGDALTLDGDTLTLGG